MHYLIYLVIFLSLASCDDLTAIPILGEAFVVKGDTRPFETPLPINREPKRLALGYSNFAIGIKEDGTVWSWGRGGGGVCSGILNLAT